MNTSTNNEDNILAAISIIRSTVGIRVLEFENKGISIRLGNSSEVFEELAEYEGLHISDSLSPCFSRIQSIGIQWQTEDDKPITGEFHLPHLLNSVYSGAPTSPPESATAGQREVFSQLRMIDDQSRWGGDSFTAIRVHPGVTDPELWHFSVGHGLKKLDLKYCQYFEALLLTKGVYAWQFLFSETSLRDREHEHTRWRMKKMLHVLPRLFPAEDYSILESRLRERL
ncbi:hypothetical protein ACIQRC_07080 [Streptomyces californicus]|uniref:hypothetical protein n=1 Tax=Streptomyces californicus TaxID=67351 RepID=UPI003825554C